MDIREAIKTKRLFFDGAMGTQLQKLGLKGGELPEEWNLTRKDDIRSIHQAYLQAGADILCTNTFGASRYKLLEKGLTPEEVIFPAISAAKEAVMSFGHKDKYVAQSIGPLGKLLAPSGSLSFEEAYDAYREMVVAGEKAGADLILLETANDLYEVKAAVLAAKENTALPIFVTVTLGEDGRMLTGGSVEAAAVLLNALPVDAYGINCGGGPKEMAPYIRTLMSLSEKPVLFNANAGLPEVINGESVFPVQPEAFSLWMKELVADGIWAAGGCCGTTPAHIAALVSACKGIPLPDRQSRFLPPAVSSGGRAVFFDSRPVLIGERINPTGKKTFQQQLREGREDFALKEAVFAEEKGIDLLDVNLGLPGIDEKEAMVRVVKHLQSITNLPLQLDTSDPKTLEAGLRIYNGKAMINSVNGDKKTTDAVFPLVKKYGGLVVCLPLDEKGIPDTAKGRIDIAKKIIKRAEAAGLRRDDLIFDGLVLTSASEPDGAEVTLETVRRLKEELNVRTLLGISNISFGLPARALMDRSFFLMGLTLGLSAAIVNPRNREMLETFDSFCILMNQNNREAALTRLEGRKETASSSALTLADAVLHGLDKEAEALCEEAIKAQDPLSVIETVLVPALDEAGKGFERGTLFLPGLLRCAEAAKAAFAVINRALPKSDTEKADQIILATVEGDVHDIGKNIVKVMLENYGFTVIDLGKNVPPKIIVERAKKEKIRLVGLSALMTTTVPAMEKTIQLLRKEHDCKIIVGGAVLTEEYAAQIGADGYGKDAMATVRFAKKVFQKE